MNLFVLHLNPETAAEMNCDRHVVKIILEAIEMIGYAYVSKGITYDPMPRIAEIHRFPFKQHYAHPMSKWVRASDKNFEWTVAHLEALLRQYTLRYGKIHKYNDSVKWIKNHPIFFSSSSSTDWPRCFGKFKDIIPPTDNIVEDYRRYYCLAKRQFARWAHSNAPDWYPYA